MKHLFLFLLSSIFLLSNLHSGDASLDILVQNPENMLFSPDAEKNSSNMTAGFSLTYSSKYIWRGLDLVDDSVLQPEFSVSKYGWILTVWGNIDMTNVNGHSWKCSEINGILAHSDTLSCQWLDLNYSLGTICYIITTFDDRSTWELYLEVKFNTPFNPSITIYYDVDKVKGWYMTYGVHHVWEKAFCPLNGLAIDLDLAASIGFGSSRYNDFYYSYDSTSFLDIALFISFPSTWKCWKVNPFLAGSYLTNGTIRHRVYPNKDLWGGVSISRMF